MMVWTTVAKMQERQKVKGTVLLYYHNKVEGKFTGKIADGWRQGTHANNKRQRDRELGTDEGKIAEGKGKGRCKSNTKDKGTESENRDEGCASLSEGMCSQREGEPTRALLRRKASFQAMGR